MITAVCTSQFGGPCDRPAVAAVHVLTDRSVLIRTDHVDPRPPAAFIDDWRCVECLHHEIDAALGLDLPSGAVSR